MRHAKSWQENQSGDDTLEEPFETAIKIRSSNRVSKNILLFIRASRRNNRPRHYYLFEISSQFNHFPSQKLSVVLIKFNHPKSYSTQSFNRLFLHLSVNIRIVSSVMQQLSNDTGSWGLIDSPLPAPLFYNSNTYDQTPTLTDLENPVLPLTLNVLSSSSSSSIIAEADSNNYWAFALIFFPLFTIFGNVLVVVSVYREKSLHTVTNYFVVSLAISDITVAAVVMPFAIYLEVNRLIVFSFYLACLSQ